MTWHDTTRHEMTWHDCFPRELKDVGSINEELGIKLPNLSPADLEDLKPGDVLGKKAKNDKLENIPDASSEDKSENDWMILLTLTTTRWYVDEFENK